MTPCAHTTLSTFLAYISSATEPSEYDRLVGWADLFVGFWKTQLSASTGLLGLGLGWSVFFEYFRHGSHTGMRQMNGWGLQGLVSFVLALSFTLFSGLPAFEL